ncbi:putative Kinase protein with adenine nucleotide alpha hydrolases-like domain [Hibiscus syriacus]|uniref:Kinase protein with adenine nucleotide alpha hydrolases-like domain n=1 Tax=Hibiscus syriacus TaxID=106335 RepID=A0A6A2ZZH6_HIBSY|nr:putative Kinase protein with adenine nucleotide alpha hydrolases-like domain [Hibiscus syriacus]
MVAPNLTVIEVQVDMPAVGAITLYVSLLTFTLRVHPDRLDYADQKYNDIVTALTLSNYPRVMEHLDNGTNKVMAIVIIESIMKNNTCISTADKVEVLFELIKGLIKDLDGAVDELDEEDFKDEQNSVAKLIHMLFNDEPEEMWKIICIVWKHTMATAGPGGRHSGRSSTSNTKEKFSALESLV